MINGRNKTIEAIEAKLLKHFHCFYNNKIPINYQCLVIYNLPN